MNQEKSIFSKIIDRELAADIVFESNAIIVIKSIQPHAPIHLLAIPKVPFQNIHELLASIEHKDLLWELLNTLRTLAIDLGIDTSGYKLVVNTGNDAGQSVNHLHIHLLGGAPLQE